MTEVIDGATVVGFTPLILRGDKGDKGDPGAAGLTLAAVQALLAGYSTTAATAAGLALKGPLGLATPELAEVFRARGTVAMAGTTAPTGQPYTVTGSLGASLYTAAVGNSVSPSLTTIPGVTGAWYVLALLQSKLLCGGMKFRWQVPTGGATTSAAGVTLGAFNSNTSFNLTPGSGFNASIHIGLLPTSMAVSTIVNGTFTTLVPDNSSGGIAFASPLKQDGSTTYDVSYMIDPVAGTAVVTAPDREVYHFTSPAFQQDCRYAFTEGLISATTDYVPEVLSWWGDSGKYVQDTRR